MPPTPPPRPSVSGFLLHSRLALAWLLLVALAWSATPAPAAAARAKPIRFDIAAGPAETALRRFSAQSGEQVLYSAETIERQQTQAVKGDLTAREALERMFAGSGLVVAQDERTGAFAIKRAAAPPEPAAPPPAKPGASALDERRPGEAVTLSPFEVRTDRDVGYAAADTLAGGRINTPLKDTAAVISVLNRQFLDDVATTNIQQSLEWSVNAVPIYNAGLSDGASSFRGPNSSYFSRNYFLWYINSDTYNTERFEFARGPNGVLFGDGNLGGIATVMTKRAHFGKRGGQVAARADSYGGMRFTADENLPLGDRVALRVNLLHDRGTSWQDRSDQFRYGAHLAGVVKLTPRNQFRFEGEWGERVRQIYLVNYAENASYWDRATAYNGLTAPSTSGTGVVRMDSSANRFVYIPGNPAAGYSNWATFYRSAGSGFAMRDYARADLPASLPQVPNRRFNLMAPDGKYNLRYTTFTGYLDHRFSDRLYAELGFSHTKSDYASVRSQSAYNQYYIDVNTIMPNGLPNPKFGAPYAETTRDITSQVNTIKELRVLTAYRFESSWLKENISAIVGTRFDKFDFLQARLMRTNGLPRLTDSSNQYYERRYWNDPAPFDLGPRPDLPGYAFDYVPTSISHQRKFIDYAQVATVSKFFADRLTVYVGGRHDHAYQTQRSQIPVPDPVTGVNQLGATVIPAGEKNARPVVGAKAVTDKTALSKNAGAVYFVLPWLGVYANFSQTFSTPDSGNNLIDGSAPGISHSTGYDGGFKFDLAGGKVFASVNYYTSKQEDQLTTTGAAAQINRIWNAMGRTDLATLAYRDTQSLELEGYEFELTANPMRNLRVMANYAAPRRNENTNALPGLRAYYAAHRAEWEAAAANDATGTIRNDLTTINTLLLNNATFAIANGTYKYRANVYGTYTFEREPLRGVAVGLGANFVGPAKVGSGVSAFDYKYSESYFLVSGNIQYRTRLLQRPLVLQLNVNNLLDRDDLIATTYGTYRAGGVAANPAFYAPNAFRYLDPRQFIFSASLKF